MTTYRHVGLPEGNDPVRAEYGFTAKEICDHYEVHDQTVRRWMKLGQVPSVKYGVYRIIPRKFIETYGLPNHPTSRDVSDAIENALDEWESDNPDVEPQKAG